MSSDEIQYKKNLPDESITDFVECFWMVDNSIGIGKEVIVMPNAKSDS